MNDLAPLTSAFLVGLMGSAHCFGMCGGIVSSLSIALPPLPQHQATNPTHTNSHWQKSFSYLLLFNIGRLATYTFTAGILYILLHSLSWSIGLSGHSLSALLLRIFAGSMLIAMGLYLGQWWSGLVVVEKIGHKLWRYIQPVTATLLPIDSKSKAIALGGLWGWLPCGMVYSALTLALAQNSLLLAMLTMFSFGLGTLPTLLLTGTLANSFKAIVAQKKYRSLMAGTIIFFGIWTIVEGYRFTLGSDATDHLHHIEHSHNVQQTTVPQTVVPQTMEHHHHSPTNQ